MDRRTFLATAAAGTIATGFSTKLLATQGSDSKMLFVFLRGAYDAASTLIPVSSSMYYEVRPTLAIAKPAAGDKSTAHEINGDWGLHPLLAEPLAPMLEKRQITFVPFVGIPGVSRSHFEAQEWLELGMAENTEQQRPPDKGILYRLAEKKGGLKAIAFSDSIPSSFKGPHPVPNSGIRQRPTATHYKALEQRLLAEYDGHALKPLLEEGLSLQREITETFDEEKLEADRGAVSVTGFARETRRIAKLMRERFDLAFVDIGGWDTHINQGGAKGALANKLAALGTGLAEYAEAMGPDWQRTTVVVVSEFGRTFRENGNRGTDHGYGTVYWVMGGSLNSKEIITGPQVQLIASKLNEERDYPVLTDYRALLGNVCQQAFGLNAKTAQEIFGVAPSKLFT